MTNIPSASRIAVLDSFGWSWHAVRNMLSAADTTSEGSPLIRRRDDAEVPDRFKGISRITLSRGWSDLSRRDLTGDDGGVFAHPAQQR